MAWLLATNYRHWFADPFSLPQVFSWIFLVLSLYLAVAGIILIKRKGKPGKTKTDKTLYGFEQTTALVETGIYKFIRHPLYSSLLFLTWGIYLKQPAFGLSIVAVLSTVFLYITALCDERECIVSFGDRYVEYMNRTKKFVPYLF
jgi:protein-S-isoprenylcysteine O-methyltransferase Ste14